MSQTQTQAQTQTKKVCKEFYYRNCIKTPAFTETVVLMDGKVLKPSKVYRSKTGAHGTDVYCLTEEEWQRTWVIVFEQSNSGKPYVTTFNVPDNVRELVEQAWLYEGATIKEIIRTVAKLQTMSW
jgi:hypothetical protein